MMTSHNDGLSPGANPQVASARCFVTALRSLTDTVGVIMVFSREWICPFLPQSYNTLSCPFFVSGESSSHPQELALLR